MSDLSRGSRLVQRGLSAANVPFYGSQNTKDRERVEKDGNQFDAYHSNPNLASLAQRGIFRSV